ncbi:death-associated inhibitor of apoptosis 1 [Homarus gammarus nudivirus]|uniref:Death-associated inhibitor of apoptosis 1 n=1 Tax=Homarus gammarus nudivirus TaxID=2509616 RepID=A0A411HBE0_9VIRU|nr:death-associated inhibitor of apoptosis 1 [Homarus gammarus nudivirus]QBB28697.1 death-associated inhibitor of apoptosis 1 [Homarus gammarus nudivirus]
MAYFEQRLPTINFLALEVERMHTFMSTAFGPLERHVLANDGFINAKETVDNHVRCVCVYCKLYLYVSPGTCHNVSNLHRIGSPNCTVHQHSNISSVQVGIAYRIISLFNSVADIHVSQAYPNFKSEAARLESFKQNCKVPYMKNHFEEFAKLGFFYVVSDIIMCFHCGYGLKNLEIEYENVTYLHALGSLKCPFVNTEYPQSTINRASFDFKKFYHQYGPNLRYAYIGVSNYIIDNYLPYVDMEAIPYVKHDSVKVLIPEGTNELDEIEEEIEENICVICKTNTSSVLFQPCNHLCCCRGCFINANATTCVVCRTPIMNIVKIKYG